MTISLRSAVKDSDFTLITGKGHEMKTHALLGFILIVVGIMAFAYQGITYTTRENVVDIGPLHMTAERNRTLPLPPVVGALALAGGIVALFAGGKKEPRKESKSQYRRWLL